MKVLENKITDMDGGEDLPPLDYAKLCEIVLNHVHKETGLGVAEMRKRHKVLDVIEQSNGEIVLEDAHAETLKRCARTMRWGMSHKAIIQFCDDVEAMKAPEPKSPKPKSQAIGDPVEDVPEGPAKDAEKE